MGRLPTILQSEYPYNISARCINREWFEIPMSHVWQIFAQELNRTSKEHDLVVHSFVLMSNHYHLIASTPKANISQCMHQFSGRVSRRLTREGNRINETFAGRYYKCILQHPNYYLNAYKYNYRNPVSAGICDKVEDYKYSTLYGMLNPDHAVVKVAEDNTLLADPDGTLTWLNTAPTPQIAEATRTAMRHQYFKAKLDRYTKKPMISETVII